MSENDDEGFEVNGSTESRFLRNDIKANMSDGVDSSSFVANRITSNRVNGIELDASNDSFVSDNVSSWNGRLTDRNGFSLDNSSGNVFTDNSAGYNGRNGIRIENRSNSIIVVGNSPCRNADSSFRDPPDPSSVNNYMDDNGCDPIWDRVQARSPVGPVSNRLAGG